MLTLWPLGRKIVTSIFISNFFTRIGRSDISEVDFALVGLVVARELDATVESRASLRFISFKIIIRTEYSKRETGWKTITEAIPNK